MPLIDPAKVLRVGHEVAREHLAWCDTEGITPRDLLDMLDAEQPPADARSEEVRATAREAIARAWRAQVLGL